MRPNKRRKQETWDEVVVPAMFVCWLFVFGMIVRAWVGAVWKP